MSALDNIKKDAAPPAPSIAVKALHWKGPDSCGEYHSLHGLWGYIIRAGNGNGFWLTEIGDYFPSPEAAQAAAQADYETRILSALSAQMWGLARYQSPIDADNKLLRISQRLIKWDTDFPVNCWNGYAGLKELDKIIADAKVAVHQAGASYDDEFGTNHPPAKEGESDGR